MGKDAPSHAENSAKTARRGNPADHPPSMAKGTPSPNPGGRPKMAPLSHACREVLAKPVPSDPEGRTYAQKIASVLAGKATQGDIRAAQELADRAEGRARQAIEIEHTRLRDAFERMNAEELEAYAVEGTLPGWFPKDDESVDGDARDGDVLHTDKPN